MLMPVSPAVNPPKDASKSMETVLDPPREVSAILRRACFDCHSNETRWPWYSRVPPGSWLIGSDVEKGRKTLNFSDWSAQSAKPDVEASILIAACTDIKSGRMPKAPYPILHSQARLSKAEKDAICGWATSEARTLLAMHHRQKTMSQ